MTGPDELRKLAKRMAWQHGEVKGNVLAHHNELCEAALAAADAWKKDVRFAMAGWNGAERTLDAVRKRLKAAEKLLMAAPHSFVPTANWSRAVGEWLFGDAALAEEEKVLHNGPAWSPPIVNPDFDTDVGGADVFKSWAEETGAVGIEATWRPVRFSQSMTCPLCHETFGVIVTANVRGAAWMDDLSAVVPCAALAGEEKP